MIALMASNLSPELEQLRAKIAAATARMIADYGTAKRKAVKICLGNKRVRDEFLPDNAQIEEEVRIYNQLFFGDTQPGRLLHLRQLAIEMMSELAQFNPYLTGAVLNGTAVIPHKRVSVKSGIFLNTILRKFYMKISRFTESQIINILKQAEAARQFRSFTVSMG